MPLFKSTSTGICRKSLGIAELNGHFKYGGKLPHHIYWMLIIKELGTKRFFRSYWYRSVTLSTRILPSRGIMMASSKPKVTVELAGKLHPILDGHVGRGQDSKGKLHGVAAIISDKDGKFLPELSFGL